MDGPLHGNQSVAEDERRNRGLLLGCGGRMEEWEEEEREGSCHGVMGNIFRKIQ